MTETKHTITMKDVQGRGEAKRLSISGGRYVTRGAPRSGGLASVYRATDTDTGETVALKVFRSGDVTDEVIEESFRREVQALSDLNHPNIVRIRDSGRDYENGTHFIVMDWIATDLSAVRAERCFTSWDEFFVSIGKGILDGLVYAYSRSTVHRDIKPSNILISQDGQPQICDFGISKIRNFLAPGVTLAQFASVPFAPPEFDDGNFSYSRDVFGYAALAVAVLCEKVPANHRDLLRALEVVPVEEDVRRLMRRCLALDEPAVRPQNVVVLQGELGRLRPQPTRRVRGTVLFGVTKNVRSVIEHDLGLRGDQAERFAERDLESACCEQILPTEERPDRSFRVIGHRYSYTAVLESSNARLLLVNALEFLPSELDRKRAEACMIDFKLMQGEGGAHASTALDGFLEQILAFSADQKQRVMEQREQALYKKWLDLLSAKTDLEKQRKVFAQYHKVESSGEFVRLTLAEGFDTALLADQDVAVKIGSKNFSGSVISCTDEIITVRPSERSKAEGSDLAPNGTVEVDTTKADAALDKQKAAVEAVRHGRAANPELGRFILSPGSIPVPPTTEVEFIQGNMDVDKQDAVLSALSGPALMLVEGPPGTGKTTFITELVLQTLRANPNAKILLTSQTHVALDNSLERIVSFSREPVRAVRIGNETDERISSGSKKLLLDAKLPEMRKEALASGRTFIEGWSLENGLNLTEIRGAMALERHAGLKAHLEQLDTDIAELRPQLGDYDPNSMSAEQMADIDERLQGFVHERDEVSKEMKDSLKELGVHFNKNDLKEFATCSAADLHAWADAHSKGTDEWVQLKKLLLAHAEWEVRFGRGREFRAALIASAQVVAGTCLGVMNVPGRNEITYDLCIVDEASIATPTEVLVPMSRARRVVLVGDNQQLSPFQDPELRTSGLFSKYNLSTEDQKTTLFRHLSNSLPLELRKTLATQHRMIPAIGNLVSECFYRGRLKSAERDPLPYLSGVQARAVTWYSTSRKSNRASRQVGTSHTNLLEIEQIVTLLSRTDFVMRKGRGKDKKISIAVLAGYSEQKQRLKVAIDARRHEWVSFSELFVNVVDAFQGREADMVVFSVTRSEVEGLGFLREMERINVALSRAKELLAIVGDHVYCQSSPGAANPLRDVIDYIRRNPGDCVLEELQ